MIDKEKAINMLNNMGENQKGYLYRKQDPYMAGFFFKPLNYGSVSSYCIVVYESYERNLVEDIIFKDEKEMKYFMEEQIYPPFFGEWTKKFGDKMLKKFPSFSIQEKHLWDDKEDHKYVMNKWGKVVACYRAKKEN